MGLFFLLIFLNGYRKSIFFSIVLGLLSLFIIIQLHPFYNDFKVIESTEYHQGLKIEKSYKCQNNTEEVCTKIITVQPSFFEIIRNFNIDGIEADTLDELHDEGLLNETY